MTMLASLTYVKIIWHAKIADELIIFRHSKFYMTTHLA